MKAETRIKGAAKSLYEAYTEYSKTVLNIPVTAKVPKVEWMAGNTKGGNAGWLVDGSLYPGKAEQVVQHFEQLRNAWEEKTKRKSDPVKK